jgi:transposase
MAKGKLKKKVDLLEKALNGKLTDHHRFLLGMHLENIDHLARQIKKVDEEIQRRTKDMPSKNASSKDETRLTTMAAKTLLEKYQDSWIHGLTNACLQSLLRSF